MTPQKPPHFQPKPVYHALIHTLKTLPPHSQILAPSWYVHNDPITLSILHQSDENRLHLVAANSTDAFQTKTIPLSPDLSELVLAELKSYIETGLTEAAEVRIQDARMDIKLPPFSIAKITLQHPELKR